MVLTGTSSGGGPDLPRWIRGATKAPDYGFYVGGARKFFVEAKKPSVNLEGDTSPASS
jgi:hypothetical protein